MKVILTLLAVLALLAGAALLLLGPGADEQAWTTDSEIAREQFEAGLADRGKLYLNDALKHFQRAAEADPDFLMPKVWLILNRRYHPDHKGETVDLIADLRRADLERVTPRERMLVSYVLAMVDRDYERGQELVEDYLGGHPDDPFAVNLRCGRLWESQRWDAARTCYERLAEIAPNQVEAQNRLGYIDMAQGRFAEAEGQFEIYRYLAPDQANPHDSMGELMMVVGRYDEAEEEMRAALALKPDFCASWLNLILLAVLRGDFDGADEVVAQARDQAGCSGNSLEQAPCTIDLWRHAEAGRWQQAWESSRACGENPADPPFAYAAALAAGDGEALDEAIKELEAREVEADRPRPHLEHLKALRALGRGDAAAAVEHGRAADAALRFWSGDWSLKLHNRRLTAAALERAGREEEAAALRGEIHAVNPRYMDAFPLPMAEIAGEPL